MTREIKHSDPLTIDQGDSYWGAGKTGNANKLDAAEWNAWAAHPKEAEFAAKAKATLKAQIKAAKKAGKAGASANHTSGSHPQPVALAPRVEVLIPSKTQKPSSPTISWWASLVKRIKELFTHTSKTTQATTSMASHSVTATKGKQPKPTAPQHALSLNDQL